MMNTTAIATVAVTTVVALLASIYTLVYLFSNQPRSVEPSEQVSSYYDYDSKTIKKAQLPQTPLHKSELKFSIVVPSYNETERIYVMLREALEYFAQNEDYSKEISTAKDAYEILIVDDGSRDGTFQYVLDLCRQDEFFAKALSTTNGVIRCIQLSKNRGKGGAVRHGMLHARGEYILFADADGASKFADSGKLITSIQDKTESGKAAIAIGSRAHMVNTDAVVKRSLIRNILMYGLHTLVFIFGIRSIKDTQCGFKLFNRKSMLSIFPFLHTERWIFDVEILILGIRKNIDIHEVAISWHEVDGSKVDLARDSINMAIDLVVIRLAYLFGIYKDN